MFVMHTISAPARRIRSVTVASYARHEALEDGRAAGERDAGDRDRVLHREALSREDALAALGAHAAVADDRVERILVGARARAGLAHGRDRRGQIRLLRRRAGRASEKMASATASSSPASSADGSKPQPRASSGSSDGSMRGTISRSRTACAPSRPRRARSSARRGSPRRTSRRRPPCGSGRRSRPSARPPSGPSGAITVQGCQRYQVPLALTRSSSTSIDRRDHVVERPHDVGRDAVEEAADRVDALVAAEAPAVPDGVLREQRSHARPACSPCRRPARSGPSGAGCPRPPAAWRPCAQDRPCRLLLRSLPRSSHAL